MVLPRPVVTYSREPSRDIACPIGFAPSNRGIVRAASIEAVSITLSIASFSSVTNAFDPLGRNDTLRGRRPTLIVLSDFAVAISITVTVPSCSDVA